MTLTVTYPNSPTMTINGNVVPVTIQIWANAALSAEDLSTYITAQHNQDQIFNSFVSNGSVVVINQYEWRDTGNLVTESMTFGNVWNDTGNVVLGTVANTGNTVTDLTGGTRFEYSVNGVIANISTNIPIINGHSANVSHSNTNISFPSSIEPTTDPTWITFWDRFQSDPNVTFPTGWGTISNV